jgi:hypothetical protein
VTRPPIAARVPAYRELAAVWPVLLGDVMRFALQAGDPSVKCGRLETFAFLVQLPEQVEAQATRQAEVDARRAERAAVTNGHPGARR